MKLAYRENTITQPWGPSYPSAKADPASDLPVLRPDPRDVFSVSHASCASLLALPLPANIPCLMHWPTTFHPSGLNLVSSSRLDYPRLLFSSLLSPDGASPSLPVLYFLTHPSSPECQLIRCFLRPQLASGAAALFL